MRVCLRLQLAGACGVTRTQAVLKAGCALLGARSCSNSCLRRENNVLLAVNFVVRRLKVY